MQAVHPIEPVEQPGGGGHPPDDGAIVLALWDLVLGQRGLMRNYRAYI